VLQKLEGETFSYTSQRFRPRPFYAH